MDCIVHGVTNIRTRLSDFHFTIYKGAYGTLYKWLEGASLIAQLVKNLPEMQKIPGKEDPLEKG